MRSILLAAIVTFSLGSWAKQYEKIVDCNLNGFSSVRTTINNSGTRFSSELLKANLRDNIVEINVPDTNQPSNTKSPNLTLYRCALIQQRTGMNIISDCTDSRNARNGITETVRTGYAELINELSSCLRTLSLTSSADDAAGLAPF